MSCMMMNPEPLAAVADFTASILNMGYNYFGFCAPERLSYSLIDCSNRGFYDARKVYSRLYALNLAAYNGRYYITPGEKADETVPAIDCYKHNICERFEYNGHYVIKPWHYRMAKLLDFLVYQCDESATNKTVLFQDLRELRDTLYSFIVCNSDGYQNTPAWGDLK